MVVTNIWVDFLSPSRLVSGSERLRPQREECAKFSGGIFRDLSCLIQNQIETTGIFLWVALICLFHVEGLLYIACIQIQGRAPCVLSSDHV